MIFSGLGIGGAGRNSSGRIGWPLASAASARRIISGPPVRNLLMQKGISGSTRLRSTDRPSATPATRGPVELRYVTSRIVVNQILVFVDAPAGLPPAAFLRKITPEGDFCQRIRPDAEKGDRCILCEAPAGPSRQNAPVPFFRAAAVRLAPRAILPFNWPDHFLLTIDSRSVVIIIA